MAKGLFSVIIELLNTTRQLPLMDCLRPRLVWLISNLLREPTEHNSTIEFVHQISAAVNFVRDSFLMSLASQIIEECSFALFYLSGYNASVARILASDPLLMRRISELLLHESLVLQVNVVSILCNVGMDDSGAYLAYVDNHLLNGLHYCLLRGAGSSNLQIAVLTFVSNLICENNLMLNAIIGHSVSASIRDLCLIESQHGLVLREAALVLCNMSLFMNQSQLNYLLLHQYPEFFLNFMERSVNQEKVVFLLLNATLNFIQKGEEAKSEHGQNAVLGDMLSKEKQWEEVLLRLGDRYGDGVTPVWKLVKQLSLIINNYN